MAEVNFQTKQVEYLKGRVEKHGNIFFKILHENLIGFNN